MKSTSDNLINKYFEIRQKENIANEETRKQRDKTKEKIINLIFAKIGLSLIIVPLLFLSLFSLHFNFFEVINNLLFFNINEIISHESNFYYFLILSAVINFIICFIGLVYAKTNVEKNNRDGLYLYDSSIEGENLLIVLFIILNAFFAAIQFIDYEFSVSLYFYLTFLFPVGFYLFHLIGLTKTTDSILVILNSFDRTYNNYNSIINEKDLIKHNILSSPETMAIVLNKFANESYINNDEKYFHKELINEFKKREKAKAEKQKDIKELKEIYEISYEQELKTRDEDEILILNQ